MSVETVRIRSLFRILNGATPTPDPANWDGGIAWATPQDLGRLGGQVLDSTSRTISETGLASCAAEVASPGCLIISTRAPIGHVALSAIPVSINQGCRILVPRRALNAKFFVYVLQSMKRRLAALGQGSTFLELTTRDLGNLRVPSLMPSDQDAIVRFLDKQTERVDELIRKKSDLVIALKEQLFSAVLDRLGGGVEAQNVRKSGLVWLPSVPSHWEVAPLYARYEVKLGKMLDAKRITGSELGPYLRNVNVQWDKVQVGNLPQMDFTDEERKALLLRDGDLLVCEGGEVGRTAMWRGEEDECYFQKAVHRLRPRTNRDVPRFFIYVMYAAAKSGHFRAGGNPNTIDHLTGDQLRHYRFPFPPPAEQQEIAEDLDAELRRLRLVEEAVIEAISKLQEFRAALITAAVTGQSSVSEAA